MKILFGITQSNFGGAQRYVYDLARSLSGEAQVGVVFGGIGRLATKLNDAGIKTIALESLRRQVSILDDFKTFSELVGLLRSEKPDVFHINSSKMGGLGALAARIAGVRCIIFTAHGWAFNEPRPLWQRFLIHVFANVTVLLSHRTIAVSESVKAQVSLAVARDKMTVIQSGIANDALPRDEARKHIAEILAINPAETIPWIVTVAELHPVKGIDVALIAASQMTAASRYIILGEGVERKNLEARVHNLQLGGRVSFAGFVDNASRYLSAFDIFLLPSRSEALGYAVLEAGAAHLPVVATRVGGIPEIVRDNESGKLVAPEKADEIKTALEALIAAPDERKRLGDALAARIATDFSIDRMVRDTKALYAPRSE
jgi:glycosyltransferase involved in cell wall biosynthesis